MQQHQAHLTRPFHNLEKNARQNEDHFIILVFHADYFEHKKKILAVRFFFRKLVANSRNFQKWAKSIFFFLTFFG